MADHLLPSFPSPRGASRAFIVGALAAGLVVMTGTWRLATRGENCVPTPSALWRATHMPRPADFTISVVERSALVAPPGYHVSGVEVSGDSAHFSYAIPARDTGGGYWTASIMLPRDTVDALWHSALACALFARSTSDASAGEETGVSRMSLRVVANGDTSEIRAVGGRETRSAYRFKVRVEALQPDSVRSRFQQHSDEWLREHFGGGQ